MDILHKIRALRDRTPDRGATEEEALAAMAHADRLMQKHQISEEELGGTEFINGIEMQSRTQRQKQRHPVSKFCVGAISEFCEVMAWYEKDERYTRFFGREADVHLAVYLYDLIHDSMERGWKEFLIISKPNPTVSRHKEYWSYMQGFAFRVNITFEKLTQERAGTVKAGELIEAKLSAIQEELEKRMPGLNFRKTRASRIAVDQDTVRKGFNAGDLSAKILQNRDGQV